MSGFDSQAILLEVSDLSELSSLRQLLTLVPGAAVETVPGRPGVGEQGAWDALSVVAGSSGLVAAVRVLPEFLRSRRSEVEITLTVRGERLTLRATNVQEVMPILERLLDEQG